MRPLRGDGRQPMVDRRHASRRALMGHQLRRREHSRQGVLRDLRGGRVSTWTTEEWVSTDDRGDKRRLVVDYDAQGCAIVTREALRDLLPLRSETRRVGKECASTLRSWWPPYH